MKIIIDNRSSADSVLSLSFVQKTLNKSKDENDCYPAMFFEVGNNSEKYAYVK